VAAPPGSPGSSCFGLRVQHYLSAAVLDSGNHSAAAAMDCRAASEKLLTIGIVLVGLQKKELRQSKQPPTDLSMSNLYLYLARKCRLCRPNSGRPMDKPIRRELVDYVLAETLTPTTRSRARESTVLQTRQGDICFYSRLDWRALEPLWTLSHDYLARA
jgi:hypothetical protein